MERFYSDLPEITDAEAREALDRACTQVFLNLKTFSASCQNHSSVRGFYRPCANDQWTTGFWPGEIWLAYERTGNEAFRSAGLSFVDSFLARIENRVSVDHHDMGFLYTPSCVAAWKLTKSEKAREAAILAARQLASRFQEKGSFIQAWGAMGERGNYRFIIDCLLNLPLLYWAAEETGDPSFANIANRHAATCLANSIRTDWSTYHTFFMNPDTGESDRGETCQGYRNDSSWARGQAWGIAGLALNYRRTEDARYIDVFRNVLEYYLSRLPSDLVPYWDLVFAERDVAGKGIYEPGRSSEPRDSSSAAIVACGLLEMARHVGQEESARYNRLARQMAGILVARYSVCDPRESNGLLFHGTYSKKSPFNTCTEEGVDECVAWGDYFYMEALTRLSRSEDALFY